jgi:hypothetical protein
MYELPLILNTKEDFRNVKRDFSKAIWKEQLQRLKDNQYEWLEKKELKNEGDGITNATHRVVVWRNDAGEVIKVIQEQYKKDPSCRLKRLGFTEEEVDASLEE